MEMDSVMLLVGLLGGGALLLFSYLTYWERERLRQEGGHAHGLVMRNNLHLGRNSVVRPVVRFTTETGQVIEAEETKGWALAIPRFPVGKAVRVAYDKANPHDFVIIN